VPGGRVDPASPACRKNAWTLSEKARLRAKKEDAKSAAEFLGKAVAAYPNLSVAPQRFGRAVHEAW